MERIWNYKQNNQKLEKEFETATPTKRMKSSCAVRMEPAEQSAGYKRLKHWQAGRLLFLLEGTA